MKMGNVLLLLGNICFKTLSILAFQSQLFGMYRVSQKCFPFEIQYNRIQLITCLKGNSNLYLNGVNFSRHPVYGIL